MSAAGHQSNTRSAESRSRPARDELENANRSPFGAPVRHLSRAHRPNGLESGTARRTISAGCSATSYGSRTPGRLPAFARELGGWLLELDARAGVLELLLDRRRLVLTDVLLHGLGRAVDQVLGLLETEARDLADGLDDVDLGGTGLLQDDRELGLLLGLRRRGRTGPAGAWRRRDPDRSRGHAP